MSSLASIVSTCHSKIQSFLAESHPPGSDLGRTQTHVRSSLVVLARAREEYTFDQIALSYNGGKDCLVLLVLLLASLYPHSSSGQNESGKEAIPTIYARPSDSFPEVEEFVDSSSREYHLNITHYTMGQDGVTLVSSLEDYLQKNPGIKAILVGVRRADPYSANLTHFDPTDKGWPDFMRIHPVIDWRLVEIWAFIRHLGLEYVSLYDQGYTSIGSKADTSPNPKLQVEGKPGQYLPAYTMREDNDERLGRRR